MLNAKTAINWFKDQLGLDKAHKSSHFIGLTANPSAAIEYGIPEHQILEFSDWVGGRYSCGQVLGYQLLSVSDSITLSKC